MKLRTGYVLSGCITGCVLLLSFLRTIPDGKLHVIFCAVGQGDAVYIRFPDGKDALVDAGPKSGVIGCLSRHMPFWDRTLDLALLTHPEADHMEGFISVLERYTIQTFIRADVSADSQLYRQFKTMLEQKRIPVRYVSSGDGIQIGQVRISIVWPTVSQLALGIPASHARTDAQVLGTTSGLNEFSLTCLLRYGTFDVFLSGDGDSRVQTGYQEQLILPDRVEVLKVPHHGSRTALTDRLLEVLKPVVSVISVGKNNYGHPAPELLHQLKSVETTVERTDVYGDIELISDGHGWTISRSSLSK